MYKDNERIKDALQELNQFHLPRWEELPDFEVYMDQLITLINRYLYILNKEETPIITPSMVNNYVKLKMIPKPEKKKYQRIHIAYLIAITMLKQVLTISEVRDGIELQTKISGLKGAYNLFCEEQENAIHAVVETFEADHDPVFTINGFTSKNTAMKLATLSLVTKVVSEKLLQFHKENNSK